MAPKDISFFGGDKTHRANAHMKITQRKEGSIDNRISLNKCIIYNVTAEEFDWISEPLPRFVVTSEEIEHA